MERMITIEQTEAARSSGLITDNLDHLVYACNHTGFPLFMGLTIMQKETRGRNIYGRDAGGALSGFPGEVTEENYKVFRWLVDKQGMKSNGVGPMQITWGGFFPDMAAENLLPWDPADNIMYAVKYILLPKFLSSRKNVSDREAFRATAKAYNGNDSYATDAIAKADHWVTVVGTGDTLVKWS
jgi:hypothetical protein